MTGIERIKEQLKEFEDPALKQTVDYLISRQDLENNFLKEDKSVKEMREFITKKGQEHIKNGWGYITNEVVFAWGVMYYTLPNSFLKIQKETKKVEKKEEVKTTDTTKKNNIVSIEEAKKKMEEKQQSDQLTLFGGETDEE